MVGSGTRTVVRVGRVERHASRWAIRKDLSRSQNEMEGRSCRLCWTRRRVCCGKKEVRGEREGERKGGRWGRGAFFQKMKGEEKGRYAQTGGEEGDIWTDFSAEDQLYWRRPTGRRPDGASRDGGGDRRRGGLWPGRGCICKSKQASFPGTPRVDVRSVLLVVGFCNDGGCHVACDTVTANVTCHNQTLSPPRKKTRAHTHTRYTLPPTGRTYTRGDPRLSIKRPTDKCSSFCPLGLCFYISA